MYVGEKSCHFRAPRKILFLKIKIESARPNSNSQKISDFYLENIENWEWEWGTGQLIFLFIKK